MTDEQKPMIYYNASYAHSGSYTLILNKRGIYAMPEFLGDVNSLQISFFLRQPQDKYRLQVGVMSNLNDPSTFVPVATVNNSSSGVEPVSIDLSSYSGNASTSPPTPATATSSLSATPSPPDTPATTASTTSMTSVSKPAAPSIPTSSPTPTTSTPTLPPPLPRQACRFPAGLSHTRMWP